MLVCKADSTAHPPLDFPRSPVSGPPHHRVAAVLVSWFIKKWLHFPRVTLPLEWKSATALKTRGSAVEDMQMAHAPPFSPETAARSNAKS